MLRALCCGRRSSTGLLRKTFMLVSFDREAAYRQGLRVRWWDFLFYASFGVVVTSFVRIAGVLLVFTYLIVPAVCGSVWPGRSAKRLLIGWLLSLAGASPGSSFPSASICPRAPRSSVHFRSVSGPGEQRGGVSGRSSRRRRLQRAQGAEEIEEPGSLANGTAARGSHRVTRDPRPTEASADRLLRRHPDAVEVAHRAISARKSRPEVPDPSAGWWCGRSAG